MKKLMLTPAILALAVMPVFAADPVLTTPNANSPAGQTPANSPLAGDATPQANTNEPVVVPLRTLSVIENAHEGHTDWQQASEQATSRIGEASIKTNVAQQIAALAPQIAKVLKEKPAENALVTVAVYKQHDSDKQMMAAVAFEGRGDWLNPSVYSRVLADSPQVPGVKPEMAQTLELDPAASSYICFYLDKDDLKATDISHEKMKLSLNLAIQNARKIAPLTTTAGAPQTPSPSITDQTRADPLLNRQPQQQPAVQGQGGAQEAAAQAYRQSLNAQQDAAQAQQDALAAGDYTTPYWDDSTAAASTPYYGADGWVPWYSYVPAYGQSAIIVRPDYANRERVRNERAAERQVQTAARRETAREKSSAAVGTQRNEGPSAVLPEAGQTVNPQTVREPARVEAPLARPEPHQRAAAPAPAHAEPAHAEPAHAEPAHAAPAPAAAPHAAPAPAPAAGKK